MTFALRSLARFVSDLVSYGWRTGRWWLPLVAILLVVVAGLMTAAQVVVPTVVYTLF